MTRGATLTEDRFGKPNSAYLFDGIDDIITTKQEHFAENNNLSVSLWVKVSEQEQVTVESFVNCSDFGVAQKGSQVAIAISLPSTNSASGTVNYEEWTHFVGTYDGNTIRAYINGSLVDEKSWSGNISDPDRVLTFGYFGEFWRGYLDDVRIYNRALTEAEIEQLY